MKVTQEKLPASQIGLKIEISAETSKKTYEKVVQDLARTVNIPGFRKGKVPRPILLQSIGTQRLKATALEEIIKQASETALKQEEITGLGNYNLRPSFEELVGQYKPGEPLTFSVVVDVPPSIELGDYKSLKVTAEEIPYDQSKVDEWLEQHRVQQATLVPVEDRPAQMGDSAVIDYQGFFITETGEAGEAIEGVQGTDFKVDIEEGRFIEGMLEGIIGMKPEETKTIAVSFPADYPREDVAGKAAIFSVTLKELKEKELPEVDDDFAEDVSEFSTLAELKASLEEQFTEQAAKETKNSIQSALIKELVKICSVELPETIIQEEVTQILTQTATQMQQMGVDIRQLFNSDNIPQMRQSARPEAISRLTPTLILQEIATAEGIKADEDAIAQRLNQYSQQISGQDIDRDKLREVVIEELRLEKTLDWLQTQATVELVPLGTLNPPKEDEETEKEEKTEKTELVETSASTATEAEAEPETTE